MLQILIVDDEPSIRSVLRMILERALKAKVFSAEDNKSALAILHKERIDVFTTDHGRPDGSGLELLETVRSLPPISKIPALMVSGSVNDTVELAAYRLGNIYVLRKPFSASEILDRILDLAHVYDRDRITALIAVGRESESLDYKETCDFSEKKARASIAKDMIAMANSSGGTIIFGVAERAGGRFERLGLSAEALAQFEPTLFADSLQAYLGEEVKYSVEISSSAPTCAAIFVEASTSLIMPAKENADACLFRGRFYARSNAARSEELKSATSISRLLEEIGRRARRAKSDGEH